MSYTHVVVYTHCQWLTNPGGCRLKTSQPDITTAELKAAGHKVHYVVELN